MPQKTPLRPVAHHLRFLRLIWGAVSFSTLLLAAVYYFKLTNNEIHQPLRLDEDRFYLAAAGAVILGLASVTFPRSLYARMAKLVASEQEDRTRAGLLAALLPGFQVPFLVSLALSEAISCIGLSMGFMGYPPAWCSPFFAVGTVFALARFPRESSVLAPIEDMITT